MNQMPAGWEETTIGDVAEVNPRPSVEAPSDDTHVSFVPMAACEAETGRLDASESRQFGELRKKSYRHFEEGDVVVAKITPSMENGKAALGKSLLGGQAFGSTEFHVLRPSNRLDARYLLHFVLQPSFRADAARQMTGSAGQLRVPAEFLRQAPISLPPLDEQQRIVETIEEQFSRLDAGVASLQRAKRNLDRFRVSILQAGVEGRLTASDPDTWERKPIGQIGRVGSGATPKRGKPEYWTDGTIPWVTSGQLNDSFVTEPAEYITEQALQETSVQLWPAGTILVAMYGEGKTRGKCSELAFPSTTNQACAAIVLKEGFVDMRPFLKLVLAARYEQNRRLASGGVQPNLSLGLIKSIEVSIPPAADQVRIVAEIERQLSVMDALEGALDSACIRAAGLRRSTLRDAFAGRLVSKRPLIEVADA